jgi:hypothetical protein
MYIPGLDILLAIVYLLIIFVEGKTCIDLFGFSRTLALALLWQIPGFLFVVLYASTQFLYFVVALELWATPLIPFISLFPEFFAHSGIAYYHGFFASLLVMIFIFMFPLMFNKWKHK